VTRNQPTMLRDHRFEGSSRNSSSGVAIPRSRAGWRPTSARMSICLHACAQPVLCHNDFHARNVLGEQRSGTLRLSGILDFEGAQAADPLMDLAKTLYCDPDVDDAKRTALLDGYGDPARKDWRKTVDLYYLLLSLLHSRILVLDGPPRQ